VPQQILTMVQNIRLFLATYGTSVRKKGTHNFAWLFQALLTLSIGYRTKNVNIQNYRLYIPLKYSYIDWSISEG
jgi:hypothetical protein